MKNKILKYSMFFIFGVCAGLFLSTEIKNKVEKIIEPIKKETAPTIKFSKFENGQMVKIKIS